MAGMVTVGNRVCDVGCDHGFVSIYLIEQGISPRALAMDVGRGPLSAAQQHIVERGLGNVIETRRSDGLHNYSIGEADTLICAGMGGGLMRKILSADREKTDSFCELILQPQSEVEQFRAWLRTQGYRITDENMIEEDGKFYPMMKVAAPQSPTDMEDTSGCLQGIPYRPDGMEDEELCKLSDRYGFHLLLRKDKVLEAYLRREGRIYEEILAGLRAQGMPDEKRENRYSQVSKMLQENRIALEFVTSG